MELNKIGVTVNQDGAGWKNEYRNENVQKVAGREGALTTDERQAQCSYRYQKQTSLNKLVPQ